MGPTPRRRHDRSVSAVMPKYRAAVVVGRYWLGAAGLGRAPGAAVPADGISSGEIMVSTFSYFGGIRVFCTSGTVSFGPVLVP